MSVVALILGMLIICSCTAGGGGGESDDDDDDAADDDDDDDDNDIGDDDDDDNDDDSFDLCRDDNDDWTVGLITCTDEVFEGYTLFAPLSSTTTYLIDIHGQWVHSWPNTAVPGCSVYLLEDGNLLRSASLGPAGSPTFQAGGAGGRVEIIDWDGNVLWGYDYADVEFLQHHDVEMLPNGNVLLLAWERKTQGEAIAAGRDPGLLQGELWVDHLVEIQPQGDEGSQIVWEWHLWDHMVQDYDAGKANFGVVDQHPELIDINYARGGKADWTHSNAVDYNPELDQVIISVLGFCEAWVIDHSTTSQQAAGHTGGLRNSGGDLLYRWGNPITYGAGDETDQKYYYPALFIA